MDTESVRTDSLRRIFARRRFPALRMAPMIDMIFLLLIFFLVAAKWRPAEDFLPMQLPAANAGQVAIGKPEPLTVYIYAAEGGCEVQVGHGSDAISIGNQTMEQDLAALMGKMQETLLAQKRYAGDAIEIVCAPEVKSEYWIRVYNVFTGLQLTDITFRMTE